MRYIRLTDKLGTTHSTDEQRQGPNGTNASLLHARWAIHRPQAGELAVTDARDPRHDLPDLCSGALQPSDGYRRAHPPAASQHARMSHF